MNIVSVAIQLLSWNGEAFLEECLDSLSRQTFKDWQIFILDNNSEDQTSAIISHWLVQNSGHWQKNNQNVGFARGHNLLLKSHDLPYIFVLNQDAILEPSYLDRLMSCLMAHPRAGSATGCLLRLERDNNGLIKTNIMDSAGLKIYRTHRVVERGRGEAAWPVGADEEIFGVPATAALYRRSALDEVVFKTSNGPEWFDEDFGSYKEDVDLAYRLRLLGWRSVYVSAARGYHHRGLRGAMDAGTASFGAATWRARRERSAATNRQSYRNHLLFVFKNFAFSLFSVVWWQTFFYETMKLLASIITEPKTLMAWRDVYRLRESLASKRRAIQAISHGPESISRLF